MLNCAAPIIYWASGRLLSYLFSWGKFSFLIFSAWQKHCWAHKEDHQLLAGCLDKGITPAEAGELQSCLIYIVIYSAGIPVLPEYELAFQHVYSHTPTESSAVTDSCTQKQQHPCIMEDWCLSASSKRPPPSVENKEDWFTRVHLLQVLGPCILFRFLQLSCQFSRYM